MNFIDVPPRASALDDSLTTFGKARRKMLDFSARHWSAISNRLGNVPKSAG